MLHLRFTLKKIIKLQKLQIDAVQNKKNLF